MREGLVQEPFENLFNNILLFLLCIAFFKLFLLCTRKPPLFHDTYEILHYKLSLWQSNFGLIDLLHTALSTPCWWGS